MDPTQVGPYKIAYITGDWDSYNLWNPTQLSGVMGPNL